MLRYTIYAFTFLLSFNLTTIHAALKPDISVEVKLLKTDDNQQLIIFNSNRALTYGDFQKKPPKVTPGVAATYSGIKMGYSALEEKGKVKIKVDMTCYFDPKQSWMKSTGRNPRVLSHEQRHFEITFIQACRLAEAIEKYPYTKNWKSELLNLRLKYMNELQEMQDNYDEKTKHGTIKEQQTFYDDQIRKRLTELDCSQ